MPGVEWTTFKKISLESQPPNPANRLEQGVTEDCRGKSLQNSAGTAHFWSGVRPCPDRRRSFRTSLSPATPHPRRTSLARPCRRAYFPERFRPGQGILRRLVSRARHGRTLLSLGCNLVLLTRRTHAFRCFCRMASYFGLNTSHVATERKKYVYVCVCVHVYMCMCMYMYMCKYKYMYKYMYM